ncbi:MAG: aminomethyl-transferring glycine dehydrogenase subunit GcvPB [Candidatus Methanomethylicia archaeon]
MFRQAKWWEPLIFELSSNERRGYVAPSVDEDIKRVVGNVIESVPEKLRRNSINIPQLSEVDVVRHFTRLSQMNYGVDSGVYPLGSCTMKYNPKINEELASLDKVAWVHPLQDEETIQGSLELMYLAEKWLSEITGMYRFTLQPAAGAHGEYLGCLIIRAYHKFKGDVNRDEIIIPDSAHGTNPASASMAGFKVVVVPSDDHGCVDMEALKNAVSSRTAGLMLTNPNTLGIFEENILEIADIIHGAGGLLYYDGANLNGILGIVRPGDMGFDIVHLNLHKTFSTPHGGGGPGSGPIGVTRDLESFLPIPLVEYDGKRYYLNYDRPLSIGKVRSFYGNFAVLVKAAAYILSMGSIGLRTAAIISVLNTNYFIKCVSNVRGYSLPYDPNKPRKHECVLSAEPMSRETGVRALDVAKSLLDRGLHAPTIYFPLIVKEALMIEFTDTETKENIDAYVRALKEISDEAYTDPSKVVSSPHNTSVGRLDDVKANHPRTLSPSWKMYIRRLKESKGL